MTDTPKCACVAGDKWECWGFRYGIDPNDKSAIELDGGPCECKCHEEEGEDDE